MTELSIDLHVDAPLKAVAELLRDSIVARFDAEHVESLYMHAVSVSDLVASLPALVVRRDQDVVVPDDDVIDDEIVQLVVEYYAPPTPVDRRDDRWALLRAVWKHIHTRLEAGFCPLVSPTHANVAEPEEPENLVPVLASHGWRVPERPPATVKYAMTTTETDPIPW